MLVQRFQFNKSERTVQKLLSRLTRSAAENSLAYRQLLETTGQLRNVEAGASFESLPLIQQAWLHDVPTEGLLHRRANMGALMHAKTSGSSGMPITVYMKRSEALFRSAQIALGWRRAQRLPLNLRVADFGTRLPPENGTVHERRGSFSILRLSPLLPRTEQIGLLSRFNPHVISGPPTSLDLLAEDLLSTRQPLRSIRLVAVRGELLFPAVRARLERAFSCRVTDFYSCEEIGLVADECPETHGIYHVNTDACYLETVDEEGQPLVGREGRVVLTNLFNTTFPLLRYEIRDRAERIPPRSDGVCACGSRRPKMRLLSGREDDCIRLPNGHRVSPRAIGAAVYRASCVRQPDGSDRWLLRRFQVVQDAIDHVTIRVIPESGAFEDVERLMHSMLRTIHPDLHCDTIQVEALPFEASGKFKKVISLLEEDG